MLRGGPLRSIKKIKPKQLLWIGLLGGLGGGINATLCFLDIPPIDKTWSDFAWQVIPAGAIHGFFLSALTVWLAVFCYGFRYLFRWIGMVLSSWIIGWISFIPLQIYMDFDSYKHFIKNQVDLHFIKEYVLPSLIWPLGGSPSNLYAPWFFFGFVGLVYYYILNIREQLNSKKLARHLVWGGLSGILGACGWWLELLHSPVLPLVHGPIWGLLVGFGIWKFKPAESKNLYQNPPFTTKFTKDTKYGRKTHEKSKN
jgi:hypothetical protein